MDIEKQKKIMIVEDEFVVAEDIRECLESMGYYVTSTVTSGEQALEKIEHMKPDLILMDILLSGDIDGIETAEKIHKSHNIPVIFVTAHSDEEILDRAKIIGPYGYILKPFDEKDLHINLEMAFFKANMDRSLRENEKKYRKFVVEADDLITRIDSKARVLYLNPASEKIFGLKPGKCIGLSILDFIHPEDKEKTKKALNRCISDQKTDESLENRIIDHQGQIHDMLWKMNKCFDEQGNLIGINGIACDITKRKRSEDELKKLNMNLRNSLAEIKRLSGCFSICGHCKRIRNEKGQWRPIEEYIRAHSEADIIHTICLDCLKNIYPNLSRKKLDKKNKKKSI